MPSVDDVYNQLLSANSKLDQIKSELVNVKASEDAVKGSVDALNATLQAGLTQLVSQGAYTNEALYQNSLQNHTIICLLKQISRHTCGIWNETHIETGLQTTIRDDTHMLGRLYASTHAEAAAAEARAHDPVGGFSDSALPLRHSARLRRRRSAVRLRRVWA